MPVVTDYTGILYVSEGSEDATWNFPAGLGTPVVVTYSFVEGDDLPPPTTSGGHANDGFTAFTAAQRANFRDALSIYEATAGVVFVEVPSGRGMVNAMATSGSALSGWADRALASEGGVGAGYLVIDNTGDFDEGSYAFLTMLHELGHAMGLDHPFAGNITLDQAIDNQAHTVMTYNNSNPWVSTLGTLDVEALGYLYGSDRPGFTASYSNNILSLIGTNADETLLGVNMRNHIFGAAGADRLFGRQSKDTLDGGSGADTLKGSSGADELHGGAGNDRLLGGAEGWADGNNSLYGDRGDDDLFGGNYNDKLYGGAGNDLLDGDSGSDTLRGGDGDDRLYGAPEGVATIADKLFGDAGNDWLKAGFADDLLSGGEDDDTLLGGGQNDTLFGDSGNDRLDGGTGQDILYGGGGNDVLVGENLHEQMYGGSGNDRLTVGYSGFCLLSGGLGDDVLIATGDGALADTMEGGAGSDEFRFLVGDTITHVTITDFLKGADKINLRDFGVNFSALQITETSLEIGELHIYVVGADQLARDDFIL